jgi:hypothetical protein
MSHCLRCGATLTEDEMVCETCGRMLAGTRRVAEVPLEEEAALIYDLLSSGGLHPVMAWLDDGGRPVPILRDESAIPGGGLLPPLTNPFAVFVPDDEAEEALQVLQRAEEPGVSDAPVSSS